MTLFVDANGFVRFLSADDAVKQAACEDLFKRARSREVELTTSESVIAEVVHVLSSPRLYGPSRVAIWERLSPLLSLDGLHLQDRSKYTRALDLFVQHKIDFEDALSIATMELGEIEEIYSYDTDFDRIEGIKRLEP